MVEQAKIDLSTSAETTVELNQLFHDDSNNQRSNQTSSQTSNKPASETASCRLSQEQLQQSLQTDIDNIFEALNVTLKQAGLTHTQIDTVFTTGGSTALPVVVACIIDTFPQARLVGGDLYNSVGSGLLMEARKRYQ